MATIWIVLLVLLAVVVSGVLVRLSPVPMPLPIVQIGLGAVLAYSSNLGVVLDPAVFFLLFLPPLLFVDGWRIPKRGFFRDGRTILALALGLSAPSRRRSTNWPRAGATPIFTGRQLHARWSHTSGAMTAGASMRAR